MTGEVVQYWQSLSFGSISSFIPVFIISPCLSSFFVTLTVCLSFSLSHSHSLSILFHFWRVIIKVKSFRSYSTNGLQIIISKAPCFHIYSIVFKRGKAIFIACMSPLPHRRKMQLILLPTKSIQVYWVSRHKIFHWRRSGWKYWPMWSRVNLW